MNRNVFIVAGARSAIGEFGGSFRPLTPIELISPVINAAIERSGLPKDKIK